MCIGQIATIFGQENSREHRKEVFVGDTFCLPSHSSSPGTATVPLSLIPSFSSLPFLIISPSPLPSLSPLRVPFFPSFFRLCRTTVHKSAGRRRRRAARWGHTLNVRAMSEVEQNAASRPLNLSSSDADAGLSRSLALCIQQQARLVFSALSKSQSLPSHSHLNFPHTPALCGAILRICRHSS